MFIFISDVILKISITIRKLIENPTKSRTKMNATMRYIINYHNRQDLFTCNCVGFIVCYIQSQNVPVCPVCYDLKKDVASLTMQVTRLTETITELRREFRKMRKASMNTLYCMISSLLQLDNLNFILSFTD